MLYVFVPYYNPHTIDFLRSLAKQTETSYRLITRDRKQDKIMWTKSVNDFYKESKRWKGANPDDVICIMNNDTIFDETLFKKGSQVKQGEVLVPHRCEVSINWAIKAFIDGGRIDSFIGRCFFMALGDFHKIGRFCSLLPYALADIDYGIKAMKKLKGKFIECEFYHPDHPYKKVSRFSLLSYENPILWTIFLLRHPNRYTLLNIAKAWYDAIFFR